jgi:hypothetical protein
MLWNPAKRIWGLMPLLRREIADAHAQRLSVIGSNSALIPMSSAPDSLLVFSTHRPPTILYPLRT